MLKTISIISLLVISLSAEAQLHEYRFGFYNVENLFHPENDSLTNDDEFTPEGSRFWNFYKYREKYHRIAKVILSMANTHPIDILGVAEVENRIVLEDIVNSRVLSKLGYAVIHKNSPDHRGIDVAAIYRPARIEMLDTFFIPLIIPNNPYYASRDMLYLKVRLKETQDTLHLFYCHWPSRYGGQAKSEPKRVEAAKILRAFYDSIMHAQPAAKVFISGDFNDEHFNSSLSQYLKAKKFHYDLKVESGCLYNIMSDLPSTKGSHRYQGEWTYLDQLILNANLLPRLGNYGVLEHEFLLEKDAKYPGAKPFRTFLGLKYIGGFSDHLPIYIDLQFEEITTQP